MLKQLPFNICFFVKKNNPTIFVDHLALESRNKNPIYLSFMSRWQTFSGPHWMQQLKLLLWVQFSTFEILRFKQRNLLSWKKSLFYWQNSNAIKKKNHLNYNCCTQYRYIYLRKTTTAPKRAYSAHIQINHRWNFLKITYMYEKTQLTKLI